MKTLAALSLLLLPLPGCIFYLPLGAETPHGLHDAQRGALADLLRPGAASRADVLCALGVPDRVLEAGRALLWVATSEEGEVIFIVGAGYSGGIFGLPIGCDYLLLVEFDDAGRVLRSHFRTASWRQFGSALPELYAAIGRDEPAPRAH